MKVLNFFFLDTQPKRHTVVFTESYQLNVEYFHGFGKRIDSDP
jgi:hypothetical protein